MDTLVNSLVGIHAAKMELKKYSTEKERQEAMERIHSKAIATSCYNILYFVLAIISVGLIRWALL